MRWSGLLCGKSASGRLLHILWFNVARTNSYEGYKTPHEIIQTRDPTFRPRIAALHPALLDALFMQRLDAKV